MAKPNSKPHNVPSIGMRTFLGLLKGEQGYGHAKNVIRYLNLYELEERFELVNPHKALDFLKNIHTNFITGEEFYGFQFYQRNYAVFEDGEELGGEVKNLSRRYLFLGEGGDFSEEIFRTIYREGYGGNIPWGDRYVSACKADCRKDRFWKVKDQTVSIHHTPELRRGDIYIARKKGDAVLNCNPLKL